MKIDITQIVKNAATLVFFTNSIPAPEHRAWLLDYVKYGNRDKDKEILILAQNVLRSK
jgi:hypothetical protein